MAEKPEDLNLPTSIVTKIIKVYIILDILYSLGLLGIYGMSMLMPVRMDVQSYAQKDLSCE